MNEVDPTYIWLSWFLYAGCVLILVLIFRSALSRYLIQLFRPSEQSWDVLEDRSQHKRQGFLLSLILAGLCLIILKLPLIQTLLIFLGFNAIIPKILTYKAKRAMLDTFDDSLVDGLTSLSSSLRAGLTIQSALQVATKSTAPAFSYQVEKVLLDYKLGIHIDEALNKVRQRVPTQSCNMAFGALIIGKQLGGPLPDILSRIASAIRERQRVEGRLRALTAQGRGQGALICSLPVLVGAGTAWLTPRRMELMMDTLPGQAMIVVMIICEILGIFLAWKVLQLDI